MQHLVCVLKPNHRQLEYSSYLLMMWELTRLVRVRQLDIARQLDTERGPAI